MNGAGVQVAVPRTVHSAAPVLVVLREAEVDAAVGCGVEPPAGDRLLAGEEVEAVDAVSLGVAEQRCLPTTEGVVGDGNRDRHVDADHADLDLVLEAASRASVVREDGGAIAKLTRVDELHAVLEALD